MTVMLLEWAATSVFLILVVLALRAALGRRMSAGLRYGLWAVVLVRLLVPVQLFTSPLAGTRVFTETRMEQIDAGVYKYSGFNGEKDAMEALGGEDGPTVVLNTVPGVPPSVPDIPDAPHAPAPPDLENPPVWLTNLGWAWLAGSAAVAAVLLLSNLRFYGRLRRVRVPLDGVELPLRAYVAVGLPSPCLFGVLRPAVYVTPEAAADPAMLRHVLAHEYTHYRHGDHIWSLLRCGALAAHWWDPLVWLAARLSRRDGELACDEGALKRLGSGERAAYGRTLLALVTAKPGPGDLFRCATTMAGDKKSLKERISRIAVAPRRVVWAIAAAVLVMALACLCAFGQKAEPEADVDVDEYIPVYAVNESGVSIEGLGAALAEWGSGTNGGSLYLAGDMAFCCPRLAGEAAEGGVMWVDGPERSALTVNLNVDDPRIQDGAVGGFGLRFTVDLDRGAVTQREFTSMKGDKFMELSDQEMAEMARVLAELMTAAEDYYHSANQAAEVEIDFRHTGNDPASSFFVPAEVLEAVKADVAAKFQAYAPGGVCSQCGMGYSEETGWEPVSLDNPVEFDQVRIGDMQGPWSSTVLGMDVEVWRINYEFHTTTPEAAEILLVGGNYLTEDGWLCPTYPGCTYEIFTLDQAGGRSFAVSLMCNSGSPEDGAELFWESVARTLKNMRLVDITRLAPDLNRNGTAEELRLVDIDGGMGQRLEVWEDGRLIYEEEGYSAHAGYNALFLCQEDGRDCLLRYNPYMAHGWCTYSCELFALTPAGEADTVRKGELSFDLNFDQAGHQDFDVNAIFDFVMDVNGLLSQSVQLLNTDEDLLGTFDRLGRLEDDLAWMDWWEPTYVRKTQGYWALPNELWDFKAAMEAGAALVSNPYLELDVLRGRELLYSPEHGERMTLDEFCAKVGPGYDQTSISNFTVLDLDGDGAREVVLNLDPAYRQWCVVLHQQDGEMRAYAFYIRWLSTYELKEDGAFRLSSGAADNDWGRLHFTEEGYETELTIWRLDTANYLSGQAVSQEEYDAACRRQEAVPDAVWYDYTPENISMVFS